MMDGTKIPIEEIMDVGGVMHRSIENSFAWALPRTENRDWTIEGECQLRRKNPGLQIWFYAIRVESSGTPFKGMPGMCRKPHKRKLARRLEARMSIRHQTLAVKLSYHSQCSSLKRIGTQFYNKPQWLKVLRLVCAHFQHLEFCNTCVAEQNGKSFSHHKRNRICPISQSRKNIKNFNEYTPYPSPSKK